MGEPPMVSRGPQLIGFFLLCSVLFVIPFSPATVAGHSYSNIWPTQEWTTATPDSQGINGTRLQEMETAISSRIWRNDIISLLIIRNGHLVYENYFGDPDRVNIANEIHSCTKSVTSILVGIALAQGVISSVDDYVLDYFPDRTFDNMDERKEAITIRHLLTMTSGLPWDESSYPWGHPLNDYSAIVNSSDWVQWMLNRAMEYAPGEVWTYNTGGAHVLSAIVSEASGMNTTVFADEFLFTPLGITWFVWPGDSNGHAMGGSDLYLIPRFMAKIGYLMLRGGQWNGQQVVPTSWVLESSANHHNFIPDSPNSDGYGYLWWTYPLLGAYCARGYLGQYIWIIPNYDLVVVITGNNNAIEDHWIVENHIIPATTPVPATNPVIVLAPIGVGISIVVILSIVYWKHRQH